MSSTDGSSGGITRRGFLKGVTAAGALGLGLSGMTSTSGWLREASAEETVEEHVAYTYHQAHCGGMCPLKCTVRDGRLVMVQPNDACAMDRLKTICLKGISEVQHIYGDGRIQAPLKRVGDRGTNQFEQVSWEEALDDIASHIKQAQDTYGKNSVVVTTSSETDCVFLQAMLGAQGRGNTGIDIGYGNGLDPSMGLGGGYAMSTPEARDWVNSKLVLTVGSNFCESTLPQVRLFFEAKEAGAKMITVDPHYSTTASKSDEWIPIEPGTDAALYFGMIVHIVEQGLIDQDFMKQHTSYPFLVDVATGKLIREHEPQMVVDEEGNEAPEDGQADPFYVIDEATGAVVPYQQTTNPSLSGTVEFRGATVRTVYDLLLDSLANYSVDWASEITGIPAEKIKELAELYAEGPSSLALGWGGNDKIANADVAGHAAAVLVALTGNVGKPGTGVGVYVGGTYNCHTAALGEWALPEDMVAAENEMASYDMRTKESNAHVLIAAGDDLCQHYGNMNVSTAWANSLDFIVSIDPYFTEGCKWADYVLPCTTRFENDEEYGNIKNGYNQILLQEKIIDPLFEAKTELWIQRELAKRLGFENALPATSRERVDAILSTSEDEAINTLTVDQIAENQGVWPIEGAEECRRVLEDYAFVTDSGRMEVYYDSLVDYGQALPAWEAPVEITSDNPLRETYPLQLSNVRTRFQIHNQFQNAEWIKQYYRPTIEVNPQELTSRGLQTGDAVRVFNDRGEFKVYVNGNESIRPGCARMYELAMGDFTIEGNMQSVTNDTMLERGYSLMCGPVTPFSDTLIQIEKA